MTTTTTDMEEDLFSDESESSSTSEQIKQVYKILVIGDTNVGKTALLTRFVEGRFQSVFMSTVGKLYSQRLYQCLH